MEDLTLNELNEVKEISKPESLKGCARAYAIATMYFPVLICMAEKYLKLSVSNRIKNGYSVANIDGLWYIQGSEGFKEVIGRGEAARESCQRLVTRLNGLL
jgi:hypothetical protein